MPKLVKNHINWRFLHHWWLEIGAMKTSWSAPVADKSICILWAAHPASCSEQHSKRFGLAVINSEHTLPRCSEWVRQLADWHAVLHGIFTDHPPFAETFSLPHKLHTSRLFPLLGKRGFFYSLLQVSSMRQNLHLWNLRWSLNTVHFKCSFFFN